MKRLLVLVPAVLFALPAMAQTAPEAAYKDLWCGLAFEAAGKSAPFTEADLAAARTAGASGTPEQQQIVQQQDMVDQFVVGGRQLIERATEAYKAAGFTDAAFTDVRTELEPKVAQQVTGGGGEAEFTFDECSALLPAGTGSATAPATESTTTTTTTTTDSMAPAVGSTTTTTAQ